MARLKFIGLFALSHGGNRNQQGGVSLWCGLRHFHVAWQNFEEILQHLVHPKWKENKFIVVNEWMNENTPTKWLTGH